MKIIEALKRIKLNEAKVEDLQLKIRNSSANLSFESPLYGDSTKEKLLQWAQACEDLSQENVKLLCAIQRTNLNTNVTIELGEKAVTKTIAEWVWRRRKYVLSDYETWKAFSDRGLDKREGKSMATTGEVIEIKIHRHFDVEQRDKKMNLYREEPFLINAALEVINAVTDLIE